MQKFLAPALNTRPVIFDSFGKCARGRYADARRIRSVRFCTPMTSFCRKFHLCGADLGGGASVTRGWGDLAAKWRFKILILLIVYFG